MYFRSCQYSKEIESIQKHCLGLALNDYESDYVALLKKNVSTTMEIKRLRTSAIESFKQSIILIHKQVNNLTSLTIRIFLSLDTLFFFCLC